MIKETVTAIGITHIVTETGSKTCLGNRQFAIGESVWTHEGYAFGTERNSGILIIPTGMVPAEGGHFVVEFYYDVFRIRDTVTLEVVAEVAIPGDIQSSNSCKFCYDAETLAFYVVSKGPSTQSYNGVTVHTVKNGVYTNDWVDLPSGGTFDSITCRVVNGQLTWTAFVKNFSYNKKTEVDGTPYESMNGTVAFYEYIGTELQNTYDYTSRVKAICDTAWETINTNYNNTNILSLEKVNEVTALFVVGNPPPYTDSAWDFDILRRVAWDNDTTPVALGYYNYAGSYYTVTSYGTQFPRMTSPSCNLISFEEKLVSVSVQTHCYLYIAINRMYGTWTPNLSQKLAPVGQLQVRKYVLLDDTNMYTIEDTDKGDANYLNSYGGTIDFAISNKAMTKVVFVGEVEGRIGDDYGYVTRTGIQVTYNGPNTSNAGTYNGEWQQPLDYGYYIDVDYTVSKSASGGISSFTNTAELNDGNGWTFDIGSEFEFGYDPRYPDFMTVDQNADIIYYTGSTDELYLIDKATKAKTLIHNDGLYYQMQMPLIEKSQSEIVSALTTT